MLKRTRIVWKLVALFFIILLLVLTATGYFKNLIDEHYAVSTARNVSQSYSVTIMSSMSRLMMGGELSGIRDLMETLVEDNPVCTDIRMISHGDGRVVTTQSSEEGVILNQNHRSCRICHVLEDPAERLAVKGHDEILKLPDGRRVVSVTTPIFNEEGCRNAECHAHAEALPVLGLIEADFSLAGSAGLLSSRNLLTFTTIAIAILLSCGAAWYVVNRVLNRPIRKLIIGMNELADRKLDVRLDEDRRDEFGLLAVSFNDLASMLSSSLTELKKSREHLQGILESTADIIITVNTSGKIQTINIGAEKILGYRRHEVFGKPIEMLFADPHDRDVAIEQLKDSDDVVNYETQFMTKGGEARDVLLTISRLRNPNGEVVGTIGISKDITEEKRLQKKLIQSQRLAAIGQAFTGIQHSMKNMLNACKGGAFMVKTGLAKDNRKMLEEGWDMVQDGISRLTDMSMDMLKYVKEWKPRLEAVDLAPTLTEIYRAIKETGKEKGVEYKLDISPELPPVPCDARMIHTAVMDIVSNALDACLWKDYDEGDTAEVVMSAYLAQDGQAAVIEVKDNGCGMTEEVKKNIFDPFFSTKSRSGTGLGLAITSRIIGVHGGRIDVKSEPNHGAVFRIVLPLDGNGRNKEYVDGKKGAGG
jgi:PAS domain S-box-containing protein